VRTVLERTLGASGPDLLAPVCATIERDVGPRYAWPGNVRELEQCVRRILLKGRYDGLRAAGAPRAAEADPFVRRAAAGELDADELLGGYCARLHALLGSYEAVARRTRLDRRTAKRYAELGRGADGDAL
jgi:DNA-binding NtrC family response regulator